MKRVLYTLFGEQFHAYEEGGETWIIHAQLCATFGLKASTQQRKVTGRFWAQTKVIDELYCLNVGSLAGWLGNTSPTDKMSKAHADKLLQWQIAVRDALADHFLGPRKARTT